MKKIFYSVFLLFILLVSCTQENKTGQNSNALKVIEAKGIWQNPDSFAKPISIPAGKPIAITAGKPKVNPTNLNVHIAGNPQIIIAGIPKAITPGTDTFLLPKTIPTIGKVRPAGLPEIVIAKDMASKDQNPANFSFFKVLQGLKHNNIPCMLQDKTGNLWFGTYGGGVSRYDGNCVDDIINGTNFYQHNQQDLKKNKKDLVKSFTNFTDKEGLANNAVLNLLQDKEGNIWFGTRKGLSRISYNHLIKLVEKKRQFQPHKRGTFL